MPILGIDPGFEQTAFVIYNPVIRSITHKGIVENEKFLSMVPSLQATVAVIEMIEGFGMPVGKETFETVFFSGRVWERLSMPKARIYRRDIKLHFCGISRAKDSNIRRVILDRLGLPGTKKKPGITYGVKKDMWSALAICLYWAETRLSL